MYIYLRGMWGRIRDVFRRLGTKIKAAHLSVELIV